MSAIQKLFRRGQTTDPIRESTALTTVHLLNLNEKFERFVRAKIAKLESVTTALEARDSHLLNADAAWDDEELGEAAALPAKPASIEPEFEEPADAAVPLKMTQTATGTTTSAAAQPAYSALGNPAGYDAGGTAETVAMNPLPGQGAQGVEHVGNMVFVDESPSGEAPELADEPEFDAAEEAPELADEPEFDAAEEAPELADEPEIDGTDEDAEWLQTLFNSGPVGADA